MDSFHNPSNSIEAEAMVPVFLYINDMGEEMPPK